MRWGTNEIKSNQSSTRCNEDISTTDSTLDGTAVPRLPLIPSWFAVPVRFGRLADDAANAVAVVHAAASGHVVELASAVEMAVLSVQYAAGATHFVGHAAFFAALAFAAGEVDVFPATLGGAELVLLDVRHASPSATRWGFAILAQCFLVLLPFAVLIVKHLPWQQLSAR